MSFEMLRTTARLKVRLPETTLLVSVVLAIAGLDLTRAYQDYESGKYQPIL